MIRLLSFGGLNELQYTAFPVQFQATLTWMLYRVSVGHAALYRIPQGLFVHTSSLRSILHRDTEFSENDTTGNDGLESKSHCNVTLSFSLTSLDGRTVKTMPAEI